MSRTLLQIAYARKRKRYRQQFALANEKASEIEKEAWKLCNWTGISHKDLLKIAAFSDNCYDFCEKLGYARTSWSKISGLDDNYWKIILDWLSEFWKWVNTLDNIEITSPEGQKTLQIFADILGMDPVKLSEMLQNSHNFKQFAEACRPMMPDVAEAHLFKGLMEGKYVTWFLERRMPEQYGLNKGEKQDTETIIKIVDQ